MKAGRFVVDTHCHILTLYTPTARELERVKRGEIPEKLLGFGEVEQFDNSPLCLYDMQIYGVDMAIIKPSMVGTTNEFAAELVERYPDKFRAYCCDQTLKIKVHRGEVEWTIDAAIKEIEAALKTGKFVGIGEFAPGSGVSLKRSPVPPFKERLDEWRKIMDLAVKYGVAVDFHEFDRIDLLNAIATEYPNVPIIFCHGGGHSEEYIRRGIDVAAWHENVYLEVGGWPAEWFEIALKSELTRRYRGTLTATQLIWGHDYGKLPASYILPYGWHNGKELPRPPSYQSDWWRWSFHQIDKIRDWLPPDEINLILGGNAAKIYKLPVPYPRMFAEGRPDLWGVNWQKYVPYIPPEQIQHPDAPEQFRKPS